MTRAERVENLPLKYPDLQFKDVDLSVRIILDRISNTLAKGGRAVIRGFVRLSEFQTTAQRP